GLSVSPAVRDHLGFAPTDVADWRFVEVGDVPPGPWRNYGENNHFVIAQHQLEKNFAEQKGSLDSVANIPAQGAIPADESVTSPSAARSANQAATKPAQSPPALDKSVTSPSAAKLEKGFAEQKRSANQAAMKRAEAPPAPAESVI